MIWEAPIRPNGGTSMNSTLTPWALLRLVLSIVGSFEQTHTDKHSLLFWQSVPYLEKSALRVRISFWWRFTKKNNDSMISPLIKSYLKCHIDNSGYCFQNEYERNWTTLVNTRNLTPTATTTAQLLCIVNELNQDV